MPDLNMADPTHVAFVDALINDDAVRAQFAANPVSVLQQYGIKYDLANPPAPSTRVPSAAELKGVRDAILVDMNGVIMGWDSGSGAYNSVAE